VTCQDFNAPKGIRLFYTLGTISMRALLAKLSISMPRRALGSFTPGGYHITRRVTSLISMPRRALGSFTRGVRLAGYYRQLTFISMPRRALGSFTRRQESGFCRRRGRISMPRRALGSFTHCRCEKTGKGSRRRLYDFNAPKGIRLFYTTKSGGQRCLIVAEIFQCPEGH